MARSIFKFVLFMAGSFLISGVSYAQEPFKKVNPFKEHVLVTDIIYAKTADQFTPYSGPVISAWDPDNMDGIVEQKRLGTISISSDTRLIIEQVTHPMGESYELIDSKTREVIHSFSYYGARQGGLYFSGDGFIYEHAVIASLCWGSVTRKYEYVDGKLIESVQQSYQINTESEVMQSAKIFDSPNDSGVEIGLISRGITVKVLAYKEPNDFLIKTPSGESGWIKNDRAKSTLRITACE